MGTLSESIFVHDKEELDRTVQNLMARGGQVQAQTDSSVTLLIKKKLSVAVLAIFGGVPIVLALLLWAVTHRKLVGLIVFILLALPVAAYLIWFSTDSSQSMTVQIGKPETLGNLPAHHWYDEQAADGASPGTVPLGGAASAAAPNQPQAPAPPAAPPVAPPPVNPGSTPPPVA